VKGIKEKTQIIAALIFVCAGAAHGESPVSGSLEAFMGFFYGKTTEYVYDTGRERERSRLEWEEEFVPFITLTGEITFKIFFLDLSVLTAIPVSSGFMQDFDYMLPGSSAQSHYSRHNARFNNHLELYPSIGYAFDFGRWYLAPSAGFLYRDRKWTAEDGYVQYPSPGQPWSDSVEKRKTNGAIISYEELIWFPTVTLEGGFRINKLLEASLAGTWYPYMEVETIDSHFLRETVFYDYMKGGMGFLAELSFVYKPSKSDMVNFIANIGFEGIYPRRGTSSVGAIGYDTGIAEESGIQSKMESNLWWITLGVQIFPRSGWIR
jgi:outer membrane protease